MEETVSRAHDIDTHSGTAELLERHPSIVEVSAVEDRTIQLCRKKTKSPKCLDDGQEVTSLLS